MQLYTVTGYKRTRDGWDTSPPVIEPTIVRALGSHDAAIKVAGEFFDKPVKTQGMRRPEGATGVFFTIPRKGLILHVDETSEEAILQHSPEKKPRKTKKYHWRLYPSGISYLFDETDTLVGEVRPKYTKEQKQPSAYDVYYGRRSPVQIDEYSTREEAKNALLEFIREMEEKIRARMKQ